MNFKRPPCPTGRYWRVEAGDTLYAIALAIGSSIDELLRLNPGVDPYNLQIGQWLCLPAEQEIPPGPTPPCPSGIYWTVAPGDTLWSIARTVGTTVERLMELNPGIDPHRLRVGMNICLPES